MRLERIHHIAIICSDYEASKYFYTAILGLKIVREVYREERRSWKCDLEVDGIYQVELFSFPDPPARQSRPEGCGLRHLAFEVDDLDSAVRELTEKGIIVEPIRKDETRGGKRVTFFPDPDGLPLELCEN
ncbi:MAG TPA: VOC family protein [Spirochaetota bacterium]|nr:VOC family protein [Spirochaetota bacterium]